MSNGCSRLNLVQVTAVGHAMLYDYQDILLCSIKGMISPASLLAGGDYDGGQCKLLRVHNSFHSGRHRQRCLAPEHCDPVYERRSEACAAADGPESMVRAGPTHCQGAAQLRHI